MTIATRTIFVCLLSLLFLTSSAQSDTTNKKDRLQVYPLFQAWKTTGSAKPVFGIVRQYGLHVEFSDKSLPVNLFADVSFSGGRDMKEPILIEHQDRVYTSSRFSCSMLFLMASKGISMRGGDTYIGAEAGVGSTHFRYPLKHSSTTVDAASPALRFGLYFATRVTKRWGPAINLQYILTDLSPVGEQPSDLSGNMMVLSIYLAPFFDGF